MSRARNLADLLDVNGDVVSSALDNITVDDEVAIGATAPSSPIEGQVWYDTGADILKAYDGTNWKKVSPAIPTITSISGTIYETVGGNITITGAGFLSDECSVEFSGGFTTTSVNVTASSDASLVVAVPAAAYASSGTVTIKVTNSDNGQSPSSTFSVLGVPTGGTITTSGGYRIHTFNSSSSFVVPSGVSLSNVEYLVIAGGGAGGYRYGGGGAGGYRCSVVGESSGGGSSAESRLSLSSGSYTVTVGAGGSGISSTQNNDVGYQGNNSVFHTITSVGGGGGASDRNVYHSNQDGGSSGGGSGNGNNTPNTPAGNATTNQGYSGGLGYSYPAENGGGGGGGAGGVGGNAGGRNGYGNGGAGVASSITGTSVTRGGGGAGSGQSGGTASAGSGGGGSAPQGNGTANTGGGGGSGRDAFSGAGGSGIVIVRYQL